MRPIRVLKGTTTSIKTSCGTIYITVNMTEGKLIECFISMGKAGGCEGAFNESLGRMISLHLQKGGEVRDIIKMLISIRCNKPFMEGSKGYLSCIDALAHVLLELEEDPKSKDKVEENAY